MGTAADINTWVCMLLVEKKYICCEGRGLEMGRSPIQGVLPNVEVLIASRSRPTNTILYITSLGKF